MDINNGFNYSAVKIQWFLKTSSPPKISLPAFPETFGVKN